MTSEDKVYHALECAENYRDLFQGVLVISDDNVGTVGKLPNIIETQNFDVNIKR